MSLQKWRLISAKDVSPSPWFPIEERTYQLPNGQIVDDFTVTTLTDVSLVVPVTTNKKIVLVNQYKPGVDEIMLQFPGGRLEDKHANFAELKKIQAGSEWNRETHYPLLQKAESLLGSMGISEEVRQNYPDLMNLDGAELNDELNRLYRGQSNGTIDNQPWDAEIHGMRLIAAQEIRKNKFGQ